MIMMMMMMMRYSWNDTNCAWTDTTTMA